MHLPPSRATLAVAMLRTSLPLCLIAALLVGCGKPSAPPAATPAPLPTKVANLTVVGPDDQPVPGALLVFIQGGEAGHQVLKTDGQGRVKVEAAAPDWRPWIAYVSLYQPGLAVESWLLEPGENVVHLAPGEPLSGVVRDPSGHPVRGVSVVVRNLRDPTGRSSPVVSPLTDKLRAQTDARGRWTLRDLPAAGTALLAVRDPRLVYDLTEVSLGPGASPVALVVRPGASLHGRVIYDTGKPAADVQVFAQMREDPSRPEAFGWSDARTAPDGAYQLPGLPQGAYNIMVATSSKDWVAAAQEGIQALPPATLKVPDLVLTRGALVQGRVLDTSTGAPLAGVSVGSYGPHRPRSTPAIIGARTDANGWYQLRVSPGESYLYVSGAPPGYDPHPPGLTVFLRPGETRTVDLSVGPERKARGWWPW